MAGIDFVTLHGFAFRPRHVRICECAQLEKDLSQGRSYVNRLRILLLAPFCDPDAVSMPYVTYSHAAALAELHDVSLVVGAPREDNVRRAKAPFRTIEVVRMPLLERIHAWSFRRIFKSNFDNSGVDRFSAIPFLSPLNGALATVAAPHLCGRVRCCSAPSADDRRSCRALSLSSCARDPYPL